MRLQDDPEWKKGVADADAITAATPPATQPDSVSSSRLRTKRYRSGEWTAWLPGQGNKFGVGITEDDARMDCLRQLDTHAKAHKFRVAKKAAK